MAQLKTFAPDATRDAIAASISQEGYAIVEDLLDTKQLAMVREELQPHLQTRAPGSEESADGNEEFLGQYTRRLGSLLDRSEAVQGMIAHPLILSVADAVLLPYCVRYQLSYTGVMYLEPGEISQALHRDTGMFPIQNPAPPLILATMWAMSDFTAENGATCLVPGSRHWDDARQPRREEIIAAEMPAGSVVIYTGNTLHGGGANRSAEPRYGLALQYNLAWLRQEENQYMAVPLEKARKLPRKIQELMGYSLATGALGFVDHQDPNEVLNGTASEGAGQIYGDLREADSALERFKISGTAAVGWQRYDVAGDTSSETNTQAESAALRPTTGSSR